MQRFLFLDGGYITQAKARSASGETDLLGGLDTDDPLICEGKLFGDKSGRTDRPGRGRPALRSPASASTSLSLGLSHHHQQGGQDHSRRDQPGRPRQPRRLTRPWCGRSRDTAGRIWHLITVTYARTSSGDVAHRSAGRTSDNQALTAPPSPCQAARPTAGLAARSGGSSRLWPMRSSGARPGTARSGESHASPGTVAGRLRTL